MIQVAYLPNRCHAQNMHTTLLTRRQTDERVVPLFGHQLCTCACPSHHLAATPSLQLNVVDRGAGRDVLQGQCIPRSDIGLRPRHDLVSDFQAVRGNDIAFLAIYIMQEGDTSRTVRIILDGRYSGRHPQLVALKVNDAIVALGAPAAMPGGNLALIVASGVLLQLHNQRFLWLGLGNLLECRNRHATTPRRGWSILSNWHLSTPMPSMRRLSVLHAG